MDESLPRFDDLHYCVIGVRSTPGDEGLTVACYAGEAEQERVEIRARAIDYGAVDRLPRLLAGRLLLTADARETSRLLALLDIDAEDQLVDLRVWESVLWPGDAALPTLELEQRAARLLATLLACDPDTLRRSAALALQAPDADRRLLLAVAGDVGSSDISGAELAFGESIPRPESLKRKKKAPRVDPKEVERLIAGRDGLQAELGHFELRAEQVAMAKQVAEALRDGEHLLVEAGTGTGKSLAYLVPGLLHAVQTGEQVTVATHTRALQDQLAVRDAPVAIDLVRRATGGEAPTTAVLKGRSNYLCLRRWFTQIRQPAQSPEEAGFLARVNLWLNETETGDRAELPLRPLEQARFSAISAEGEACDATHCVFQQRNQCFLYRARRRADGAHLIITNHALLMTDLAEGGAALPLSRHLVVDEAHHLEQQATISFSRTLSATAVTGVLDEIDATVRGTSWGIVAELETMLRLWSRGALDPSDGERASVAIQVARNSAQATRLHVSSLFGLLHAVATQAGDRNGDFATTLRLTPAVRHAPSWAAVEQAWDVLNGQLRRSYEALGELRTLAGRLAPPEGEEEDIESDLEIRITTAMERLIEISALGSEALLNPEEDSVYWVEAGRDASRASVRTAPLDLAGMLQEQLYARLDSVVLTSATLASDGSFGYVKERLGLPDAEELALSSPFDFERAALLCSVSDIPEPNVPGYADAVHEAIVETAMASGGRTLVLFTSLAAMNAARRAIAQPLSEAGLSVVTQHEDGNAEQLAERLRSFERTVVLGAAAFWEGIDVPGPALSSLVIVRLPFAVPTDPIVAARSERFDNPFMEYSLPEAILRFRQGFGRLIRRRTDRGVCVVLDRRVLSKRYGALFLRALPPCAKVTVSRHDLGATVADWLLQ